MSSFLGCEPASYLSMPFVRRFLVLDCGPEQISGILKVLYVVSVSHETIYYNICVYVAYDASL